MGCYQENTVGLYLNLAARMVQDTDMTSDMCINEICDGYLYAAVSGDRCMCDNTTPWRLTVKLQNYCVTVCPGDPDQHCGGAYPIMAVWERGMTYFNLNNP